MRITGRCLAYRDAKVIRIFHAKVPLDSENHHRSFNSPQSELLLELNGWIQFRH